MCLSVKCFTEDHQKNVSCPLSSLFCSIDLHIFFSLSHMSRWSLLLASSTLFPVTHPSALTTTAHSTPVPLHLLCCFLSIKQASTLCPKPFAYRQNLIFSSSLSICDSQHLDWPIDLPCGYWSIHLLLHYLFPMHSFTADDCAVYGKPFCLKVRLEGLISFSHERSILLPATSVKNSWFTGHKVF